MKFFYTVFVREFQRYLGTKVLQLGFDFSLDDFDIFLIVDIHLEVILEGLLVEVVLGGFRTGEFEAIGRLVTAR